MFVLSSYSIYSYKQTTTPVNSFWFFRYLSHHCGYKCFDLLSRKIIISRHVLFDETQFPFAKIHTYRFLDHGSSPYMVHHFNTPINPQVAPLPPLLSPFPQAQLFPPCSLSHPPLISHSSLPTGPVTRS